MGLTFIDKLKFKFDVWKLKWPSIEIHYFEFNHQDELKKTQTYGVIYE